MPHKAGSPLLRNPLSISGAWLTTLSAVGFIGYLVAEGAGFFKTPYSGLLGFVAVPAVFVLGLLLIPLGMWREARRRRRGLTPWHWPLVDFRIGRTRAIVAGAGLLTIVNVVIVGVAGLGATHYMETTTFCGQVCHEPMQPEFTAHAVSPHSSVACVSCHVGPGAEGTIRAKMNGTRQLYKLALGTYARPIPVPARGLPAAAGTCERCHTPGRPERDITRTLREYADDEVSTEKATDLVLFMARNHWHARKDVQVEYVATDAARESIPYVRVTDAKGQVTEYFAPKTTSVPAGEVRRMDCVDCHTRPAHTFSVSAEAAVDRAIARGELPRTLPFVHREVVASLKAEYLNHAAAAEGISQRLKGFYSSPSTPAADVARVVDAATRLYQTNVFPAMKVSWGTYQSQMGHSQLTGCFRCHDDEHKARDGRSIRQDCGLCHKEQ